MRYKMQIKYFCHAPLQHSYLSINTYSKSAVNKVKHTVQKKLQTLYGQILNQPSKQLTAQSQQ